MVVVVVVVVGKMKCLSRDRGTNGGFYPEAVGRGE